MDWRIVLGLSITSLWIAAGLFYLLSVVGWFQFLYLPTADIGSFLEGAFAPLAFLWLVIGHFMQQKEISANTRAISLQEQSARRLEVHSRRDSYFKLQTLVQEQLGSIAGYHYISVCGPTGWQRMTQEEFFEQRTIASTGDPALFIRRMIELAVEYRQDIDTLREIFFGTPIRRRHSETFVSTFERLLEAARKVDHDGMLTDALLKGAASGVLYEVILWIRGDTDWNPILGTHSRPGEQDTAAMAGADAN
jgi:hypothetical protein